MFLTWGRIDDMLVVCRDEAPRCLTNAERVPSTLSQLMEPFWIRRQWNHTSDAAVNPLWILSAKFHSVNFPFCTRVTCWLLCWFSDRVINRNWIKGNFPNAQQPANELEGMLVNYGIPHTRQTLAWDLRISDGQTFRGDCGIFCARCSKQVRQCNYENACFQRSDKTKKSSLVQ